MGNFDQNFDKDFEELSDLIYENSTAKGVPNIVVVAVCLTTIAEIIKTETCCATKASDILYLLSAQYKQHLIDLSCDPNNN